MVKQGSKFNIVFIIDGLGMGGAERLMVPILKNLNREWFEPRVCFFQIRNGSPIAEDIRALNVPVDFLPIPYLRDMMGILRLRKYLKDVNADLVHTQLEFADVFGNIAAKLLRLPSVSTVHTMPAQDMELRSRIHQEVELFCLRKFCNAIISVSEEAREFYLKISKIPPDKLRTIYNGVDIASLVNVTAQKDPYSIREQFGIPQDAKLLVTVAVLRELKGIQFMIRALPLILSKYSDVYYLIVGSGPYKDALEYEVERVGVKSRVIFSGQRSDVNQILLAADIFALPTLTEALPTVLAEAMAARLPIVASAVGGIPEMILDGENGILTSPSDSQTLADACISLLTDTKRAKAMGEAGWQVVNRKFNIQIQVKQLESLYLGLVKAHEK
ncbi:MAG: glycosyltransferase [bacterium]|nr:glycosyltransferase [bacterium]